MKKLFLIGILFVVNLLQAEQPFFVKDFQIVSPKTYGGPVIRDVKLSWTNNTVVLNWTRVLGINQIHVLKWHQYSDGRSYVFDGMVTLPPNATSFVDNSVSSTNRVCYGVRTRGPEGISWNIDVFFNQLEDGKTPVSSQIGREMLANNVTNAAVSMPSSKQ